MPPIHELPRFMAWFLRRVCPDALFEEIEGDLIQRYNAAIDKSGLFRARLGLFWNILWYVRPGILLRNRIRSLLSLELMLNYIKITGRVMFRHKMFTFINVTGLTMGITGALLLFLWIAREFTFDDFHPKPDRIYVAYNRTNIEGEITCWPTTPRILAPTLREEYPGLEHAISVAQYGDPFLLKAGENKLTNDRGIFTEPGFLQMFNFPLMHGDAEQALDHPSSIVISREMASTLFKDKNSLGETITISASGYDFDFMVTGILSELPDNTRFSFDFILPFSFLESLEGREENWLNNSVTTYVKLGESSSLENLNASLAGIIHRHTQDPQEPEIFLYPLLRTHLYGQFENGVESGGRIAVLRMLILLAIFLLVIASINFINLSTARAAMRAREIGVRKVNGARRSALITQFLTESHIVTVLAFGLALLLVYLILPGFNQLIGMQLSLPLEEGWFWLLCLGMIVSLGLLAGTYPALALSSFRPTIIFQKKVAARGGSLRKGLVIVQFGLAVTMIFSAVVIHQQINFLQNRQAGYEKERLIYHTVPNTLQGSLEAYRTELVQSGLATSVSFTASKITEDWSSTYGMEWPGKRPDERIVIDRFVVDDQLVPTAGLRILEGRNLDFSRYPSDSTATVINQAAVREMRLENALGTIIKDDARRLTVVGVLEDFVLKSPMQKVEPMILIPNLHWNNIVNIRIAGNQNIGKTLKEMEKIYSKYEPDYPFEYEFVDQVYARKFDSIRKTEIISRVASLVVILIACLGLYGLTLFVIQQRMQEVSIRRIFGGSVGNIMKLLGWQFLSPIVWAIVVFSPMAWMSMQWWLQSFDYRISLSFSQVVITGMVLMVISLLTVVFQIWKTSRVNPAEVLRRE